MSLPIRCLLLFLCLTALRHDIQAQTAGVAQPSVPSQSRIITIATIYDMLQHIDPRERTAGAILIQQFCQAGQHKQVARAIPLLVNMLRDDTSVPGFDRWGNRMSTSPGFEAAEALGLIGEQAMPSLLRALGDPNPIIRKYAAHGLGVHGAATSVIPLLVALNDGDAKVRFHAAKSLGVMRVSDAVPALITHLADSDFQVRLQSVVALYRIGDARTVEPLIACLDDANPQMRRTATYALAAFLDARAISPLCRTAMDTAPEVRLAALNTLGKYQSEQTVDTLLAALKDTHRPCQVEAVRGLCETNSVRAVEACIPLCRDADPFLRSAALAVIGTHTPTEQLADYLFAALTDSDTQVRNKARSTVGGWATQNNTIVVNRVLPMATAEDASLRMFAGAALAHCRDARALPTLITLTKDGDQCVRVQAIESLLARRDRYAMPVLIALVDDEDTHIRMVSSAALEKLSGKAYGMDRARWARWWASARRTSQWAK